MDDAARSFLFDLLNTASPSGFEVLGQRIWANYMRSVVPSVESDHYGNTWATLQGQAGENGPKLMLEAHADEIGFMVNQITEGGYLRVVRIGGSDRAIARGRRVRVIGSKGEVPGVIGNTAIHIREKKDDDAPEWHELFVDIGASKPKDVAAKGIRVGHPAVYSCEPDMLAKHRLVGRALDNRIGGYVISQVVKKLGMMEKRPFATINAVNAVQEEIGGNGAKMVTYRLQPSVAIVIDVTHATDTPGINKDKHGTVKLGAGPSITHGTANHPKVVSRLMDVAKKEGISLQHEASSRFTGTDTDDVFVSKMGIPSALVSLPMRYMHSPIEMVDIYDVERCIELLTAFAYSITSEDDFRVEI